MNEPLPESDEQLLIKKRARRRLIGAVVFASFAAVVLPMVMDQEAPPATPTLELKIPEQEKGFVPPPTGAAKPSIGVAEPVAPSPTASAPANVPAPVAAMPVKPVPATAPAPVAAVDKSAEKTKPVLATAPSKTAEPVPAPKTPAKPEPKPVKPEPLKAAGKPDDAKRAQALLEGKPTEAPAALSDGPHVILVGAFAEQSNVQILQKKIGELGYKVYTEPLDKKTRVRVGPFTNREAAEKALARMKIIKVNGVVAAKP